MACVAMGEAVVGRGSAITLSMEGAMDRAHRTGLGPRRESGSDIIPRPGKSNHVLSLSSSSSLISSSLASFSRDESSDEFSSSSSSSSSSSHHLLVDRSFAAGRLEAPRGRRSGLHSVLSSSDRKSAEAGTSSLHPSSFSPVSRGLEWKNVLRRGACLQTRRDGQERTMTSTRRRSRKVLAMAQPAGGDLECRERLSSDHFCQIDPMPEIALEGNAQPFGFCDYHIPIYVALPEDTVCCQNKLNHSKALRASLRALKIVGVDGVVVDVWWGAVEKEGPMQYDWSAYDELIKMVREVGLKVRAWMSFHGRCGMNGQGGSCASMASVEGMTLPPWVMAEGERNPDVFYTDKRGKRNKRYLSLGVDHLPLFQERSPVEMYKDFMASFKHNFADYLGNTIAEVGVGLGPSAELKYPAHPVDVDETWEFPGVGEFQCYDKYMLSSLKACALATGNADWGHAGPHDSGTYNDIDVQVIPFFEEKNGSWRSDYGAFFLSWYSQALIAHGDRILAVAAQVFNDHEVLLSAKLPQVHWMYKTRSHAAELTAGFYNTAERDGYEPVIKMIARHAGVVNLSGVELRDEGERTDAISSPQALLLQLRQAAAMVKISVAAENVFPRYQEEELAVIRAAVYGESESYPPESSMRNCPPSVRIVRTTGNEHDSTVQQDGDHDVMLGLRTLVAFTFRRMGVTMFDAENWRQFVQFVMQMDKISVSNKVAAAVDDYVNSKSMSSSSPSSSDDDCSVEPSSPGRSLDLVGGGVSSS